MAREERLFERGIKKSSLLNCINSGIPTSSLTTEEASWTRGEMSLKKPVGSPVGLLWAADVQWLNLSTSLSWLTLRSHDHCPQLPAWLPGQGAGFQTGIFLFKATAGRSEPFNFSSRAGLYAHWAKSWARIKVQTGGDGAFTVAAPEL